MARCITCGDPTTKTRCKPCGYRNRKRPSGMTYKISMQNPSWFKDKGGWVDEKGYRRIKINGKNRRQHVQLMEVTIGRKLMPDEVVHHINGIKTDNRIENLKLMYKSDHDRLHNGKSIRQLV